LIYELNKDESIDRHIKEMIKVCLSDKLTLQGIIDGILTELLSVPANHKGSGWILTDSRSANMYSKSSKEQVLSIITSQIDFEDLWTPCIRESTSLDELSPSTPSVWNRDSLLDAHLACLPMSTFKPEVIAARFHLVKVGLPEYYGNSLAEEKNRRLSYFKQVLKATTVLPTYQAIR
jgi:predicted nucleic acid-binding Zn ribbon protein